MVRLFQLQSPGLRGRRAAASGALQRWLPVNSTPATPSPSPRKGWQEIQRLKGRLGDPVDAQGCSALVRTLRKALRPGYMTHGKTPSSFWRKAAYRGGQLSNFLRPEETCEMLTALADAQLQWKQDAKAAEGLRLFASHASEEIGSFTALQMGEIMEAFARLQYQDEELLQAVMRTVSLTVSADSGRFSNAAAVKLLCSFQALGVADQTMMRSLSKLFMRRIVREPLSATETAKVAIAFSALQVRDVGLFNATTLGLCRPDVVEALSWQELSQVATAYASLRLYSQSLFGRIRHRLAGSSSVVPVETYEQSPAIAGKQLLRLPTMEDVWESLEAQEPVAPPMQLPPKVVARFLEAQLHLGHLNLDLSEAADPLLPHLAHCAGPSGRPTVELSNLLIIFLSRGHHALPWLWRRAVAGAFVEADTRASRSSGQRLPSDALLPLTDAFTNHLELLQPLLLDEKCPNPSLLLSHLRVVGGGVRQLWSLLARRSTALPQEELQEVAGCLPKLFAAQRALLSPGAMVPVETKDLHQALEHAAVQAMRRFQGELVRREETTGTTFSEMKEVLEGCGVKMAWVMEDAEILKTDSIAD